MTGLCKGETRSVPVHALHRCGVTNTVCDMRVQSGSLACVVPGICAAGRETGIGGVPMRAASSCKYSLGHSAPQGFP